MVDTESIAEGSADATKEVRFEVDGITTATVRVLTMADRNVDLSSGGTFAENTHTHLEADVTDLTHKTDLNSLTDVTITSVASGEIVKWSGAAWVNNTLAEAGVSATGHTHVEANITDLQSYLLNIVEDTTPQLGGHLDINGQVIGDGTRELLTFVEDGSAVNQIEIENQATGSGAIIRATGDDTNVDGHLATKASGKWIVDSAFDVQGNITLTGTADGRDLATDGTKLDGIESGATADQTQEEIEDIAGALVANATGTHTGVAITYQDGTADMDFIVDHDAATNFLATEHVAEASIDHGTISGLADDDHTQYLQDVVDDTTPQLGGDIDVNGKKAVSVSNGVIIFEPNGTGSVDIQADNVTGPVHADFDHADGMLHIRKESDDVAVAIQSTGAGSTQEPNLFLERSKGTFAAPTIITNGNNLGNIYFGGYDGDQFIYTAYIQTKANGTVANNKGCIQAGLKCTHG